MKALSKKNSPAFHNGGLMQIKFLIYEKKHKSYLFIYQESCQSLFKIKLILQKSHI